MKEGLDNKFSDEFYQKANAKRMKGKGMGYEDNEDIEESEGQLLYKKQREYFLKMLGEEKINQLEDLTNLEVQKQNIDDNNNINNEINNNNDNNNIPLQKENIHQEIPNQENIGNNNLILNNIIIEENNKPSNPLKKKENPDLLPPNYELLKNKKLLILCVVLIILNYLLIIKKKIQEIIKECHLARYLQLFLQENQVMYWLL